MIAFLFRLRTWSHFSLRYDKNVRIKNLVTYFRFKTVSSSTLNYNDLFLISYFLFLILNEVCNEK